MTMKDSCTCTDRKNYNTRNTTTPVRGHLFAQGVKKQIETDISKDDSVYWSLVYQCGSSKNPSHLQQKKKYHGGGQQEQTYLYHAEIQEPYITKNLCKYVLLLHHLQSPSVQAPGSWEKNEAVPASTSIHCRRLSQTLGRNTFLQLPPFPSVPNFQIFLLFFLFN